MGGFVLQILPSSIPVTALCFAGMEYKGTGVVKFYVASFKQSPEEMDYTLSSEERST